MSFTFYLIQKLSNLMRVEFQLITPAHSWPFHMCLFPIPPIFPTLLASRLRFIRHTQHLEYATLFCLVNSNISPETESKKLHLLWGFSWFPHKGSRLSPYFSLAHSHLLIVFITGAAALGYQDQFGSLCYNVIKDKHSVLIISSS